MKLTGENRSTRGKTCPSSTLSTTNPTRTDPGSNPANRLSHATACISRLVFVMEMQCVYCEVRNDAKASGLHQRKGNECELLT
jgi:hypothetical protein